MAEPRREESFSGLMWQPVGDWIRRSVCACAVDRPDKRQSLNKLLNRKGLRWKPPLSNNQHSRYCLYIRNISIKFFFFMNYVYFMYCWCYYLYIKKAFNKIGSVRFFFFLMLTWFQPDELQVDQLIIFGPDNRSTGSITTSAVEKIPRELGLTYSTEPYWSTTKIVKDGGPVGLGYGVTSLVKCQRVIVTLMLP